MEYINIEKDLFYENYNKYISFLKKKERLFVFGSELSSANIVEVLKNENIFGNIIAFVNNDALKKIFVVKSV